MFMIVIDATIVNVALPSIKDDLDFSQNNLAWVVNAYMIPFGGLLLLAGRIGDLVGQRRVFLIGLAIFTAASLLCAGAQNQEMLIGSRFIQGVGGALTSAVILGMIVMMFPEPRDRAKAIGVFGFVASAGGSVGLLAGGALTEAISWHWIFLINLPVGIITALLTLRLVEAREGIGLDKGADIPGAVLLTAGLMLGVYTILGISEHGWGSTQTIVLSLISDLLIVAFVVRQARIPNPLMPLRLFRSRNVSGANVIQALLVAGMFGMFFMGALYLQQVLGYNPLEVGLAFLPATIMMGTMSLRYSERLSMRYGPRNVMIPALIAIGAGLALFARTPVDGNYFRDVMPPMILMGLGAGSGFPAIMMLAMSGATPAGLRPGVGTGQHEHAGRRRDRAGAAGDARHAAHRHAARPGCIERRRAQLRLPPRLPDRRRAGRHRARDHGAGAEAGQRRRAEPRGRSRAGGAASRSRHTPRRRLTTMTDSFTLKNLADVEDSAPKFGFEDIQQARFATKELDAESTGVSYHRLNAGKRQAFAHRHDEAEEVYVVTAGSGRLKLDDEIVELAVLDAVRVAPGVMRQFEAGPDGLELIAFGPRHDGDGEIAPGWWSD